ncbi:MAG: FAD/NAD(P)-binding oxidoreductase [Acidimicrobiales bacterium]|nr:FAD/NAD(P)-binding oxidoreductase [Acidimicrobiales bacterium]MDP6297948.1 FAD/NAD(P)-binding oxidoreductase [Acidimicrobiales bacterium]
MAGASLAGLRTAETLRKEGFDGNIHLVGDEPHLPYDRPPLSKQILSGDWDLERVALTDPAKDDELSLEWHLGDKATQLSVEEKIVSLDSGTDLSFDGLVIATGARCISLRMAGDLEGIYTLRGLDDALAIRSELEATPQKVVVVGAGFIGAEVAATARQRGLEVTMIEAAEVPFERVLGPEMGTVTADVHRDHGVEVITGVAVESFKGNRRVEKVILEDGTEIEADLVIVGIGVKPNTEWLEGSGLTLDNGVLCDDSCEAAPAIVAAGDVARWPNRLFNENMRVEHWDNAVEQGVFVARRLLAGKSNTESYSPTPWFWTDQFDRKIQLAGRTRSTDEIRIVTGSIEERRFATAYGREGKLVGILGFNRPRHVMQYKQMIADGTSWEDAIAHAEQQAS